MNKPFLTPGNGHQRGNRQRALACFLAEWEGATVSEDGKIVEIPGYGRCHFSAYTHSDGAMISTPSRDDNDFGSAAWHHLDNMVLFRDMGDGRCVIYISPIKPLFSKRTIGQHGVRWPDVDKLAHKIKVFRPES